MLVRIREVLAEVILPELPAGHAQTQLQYLLLALDDVAKMEDLHVRLLDENDDLEVLLVEVLSSRPDEVVEAALRENTLPPRRQSFRETDRRNAGLRGALAHAIEFLASDHGATAVREKIRAHLTKYLDRDAKMGVMVAERKR